MGTQIIKGTIQEDKYRGFIHFTYQMADGSWSGNVDGDGALGFGMDPAPKYGTRDEASAAVKASIDETIEAIGS